MSSHTFSRNPLLAGTPPTLPRSTPKTPKRQLLAPEEAKYKHQTSISGSWLTQLTPVLDRLVSSPFPNTYSDNSPRISRNSLERGKSPSIPAWLTVCNHAPAIVAYTRPAIEHTQLETQTPQTQRPIPVVGEQVLPKDEFLVPAIHQQRPKRRVLFSETDNILEFSVSPENNLRPVGDSAASRAARTDKAKVKLNPQSTSNLRALKQDAAERAVSKATLLAAKERERRDRRRLQLADSGDAELFQADTDREEASRFPETKSAAAARSDASPSEFRSERGASRLRVVKQGILICIIEGPSLGEIREMRRLQNKMVAERSRRSVSETDESFGRDSPAVRSLRRALLRFPIMA